MNQLYVVLSKSFQTPFFIVLEKELISTPPQDYSPMTDVNKIGIYVLKCFKNIFTEGKQLLGDFKSLYEPSYI